MTRETIRRIPELNNQILRDEAQLRYLKEKATSVPALSTKEKVQSSRQNDSMKYADAAVDLEVELVKKRDELRELTEEAIEWIETLDTSRERRIFRMRLIQCYTWEEIADLIGYSRRRTFEIAESVIQSKTASEKIVI